MRWIVGDIHGMLRPLEALLEAVARRDAGARLLFAGDYVNRGPDSKGVIDLLLGLSGAQFVRGNHDDVLAQVLGGAAYAFNPTDGNRLVALQWFMQHGLDATLASYGVDRARLERLARRPSEADLLAVAEAVPAEHRRFVCELPAVIEEGDLFVAHAKWDADELSEWPDLVSQLAKDGNSRQVLLWGRFRDEEIVRAKAWKRTGFFGHTPVSNYPLLGRRTKLDPIVGPRIVMVDTGAALGANGRLTAYCAETGEYLQAGRMGEVTVAGPAGAGPMGAGR